MMTTLKEYKAMMECATDAPWIVSLTCNLPEESRIFNIHSADKSVLICEGINAYNARIIAASRNIAPELIRVIELAEEALVHYTKVVVADHDPNSFTPKVKDGGSYAREALSEIRKLKGE